MNHTASQASSAYVKASFQSKATKQQSSNLGKYNYYQVLELPNFASIEQVKLAYRDLAKRWHPDFHLENKAVAQEAEERFKAINMAYVTLKSPETKALYDDKLRLLLEKIAAYMAKKDPTYMVPTTVTNPSNNAKTPSATATQQSETLYQAKSSRDEAENLTPPIEAPPIAEQPRPKTREDQLKAYTENSQPPASSGFQKKELPPKTSLRQPNQSATINAETKLFQYSETVPKASNEKVETLVSHGEVEPSITIRREQLPLQPVSKKGDVTELESIMPHYDFLTRLRHCLHPPQPVMLFTKEKTEVEGILNLTTKQAKAGKSIRLQLDASHCEKFNLPSILQLQLPKNLQEGQRLKITEDAWQEEGASARGKKGGLSKVRSLSRNTTAPKGNQSLVLVVHIQEETSLLSKILALGGALKANPTPKKPLFPSSAPAMETPPPEEAGTTIIDPIIIEEKISIPLPLAILGGVYAFTSTTGETVQVPIPSGIEANSILNVAGRNNTLFEIQVQWQLPKATTLSLDEKRLYETLMLIALTEEERIKIALKAVENEQTAAAE